MNEPIDVAIIGAGICGMTAATSLLAAGLGVRVLDKSRGPGGRSASRRRDELRFDHGVPAFAARSSMFDKVVQDWVKQGVVGRWESPQWQLRPGHDPSPIQTPYYVGVPKMSALARHLGAQLACSFQAKVQSITSAEGHLWRLRCEDEQSFLARAIICTAPPAQTQALFADCAPTIAQALASVKVQPCWTLMIRSAHELLAPKVSRYLLQEHPSIASICAEHRKPDRPSTPAYVVHATASWSQSNLEQSPEWVQSALSAELEPLLDASLEGSEIQAHRWRYANLAHRVGAAFLEADAAPLFYAGDACRALDLGPDDPLDPLSGVEQAYGSALAVAKRVAARLGG